MVNKGILLFYDWESPMSKMPPKDFKKMVLAIYAYQVRGESLPDASEFDNATSRLVAEFVFPQLERRTKYAEIGKLGGQSRWANANGDANSESIATLLPKDKDKDKDIDYISPHTPLHEGGTPAESAASSISALVNESPLSDALKAKLREWLAYKGRSAYKLMGAKALVTRTVKAANEYGDAAVCDIIDDSIANAYKGILWDRLRGQAKRQETVSGSFDTDDFWDLAVKRGSG